MVDKPVTFIHMTDLHINAPDLKDDMLFNDTTRTLELTLAEIARMDEKPLFIIASGDLTNQGDADSYRALAGIIDTADLDIPVIYALGNHDKRDGFAAGFPDLYKDPSKPYDHDCLMGGMHIIVMDSSFPKAIGGSWETGQMDWLRDRLDAHADLPKLLVMHHAPMIDTSAIDMEWESLSLAATNALADVISGRNVIGILSGHIHMDCVVHWRGVPIIIGAGHHAGTDVVALPGAFNMLDATGFAVCTLYPTGLSATFVPHPQTREVRHKLDMQKILDHIAATQTAAE